ncbi:MAG: hypothetical protein RLZZ511_1807 [Cyanobacteriota bacterium]|jgi:hypothetical protein
MYSLGLSLSIYLDFPGIPDGDSAKSHKKVTFCQSLII